MAAPAAVTAARATSGGVAFLSRHSRPLQAAARHSPGDRIAAATCRLRGAHLLLCAVYLHTGLGPVGENLRVLAALVHFGQSCRPLAGNGRLEYDAQ